MREMKASEFLFFLIESLTQHEKRHFKLNSNFQSGDEKIYIQMFDILDKMGKKYNEDDLLLLFGGDKKKLSVGKNFLYNKILRSLRTYNERSSTDIQLSNLISEVQILIQKGLFHLALKRLKMAKKTAIEYEKSLLLVKIIDIEVDIINHLNTDGSEKVGKIFEELFKNASNTLENYKEALELKRLNRALHSAIIGGDAVHQEKHLEEIKNLPKDTKLLKSFYAKNNYHSALAYYHHVLQNFEESTRHLWERVNLWDNHKNIKKSENQLYRIYLSNYVYGCITIQNYKVIPSLIEQIRAIPAKSKYEKASEFQNADYYELLYYIETARYERAVEFVPKIEKNIILHRDSISKSREVYFYYNITLLFFGLKEYVESKKWLNKILYDQKSVPSKGIKRFAWILEIIIHHKLESDEVIRHIYNDAQFPMNRPNPHPFQVLAFGHLKKIVFALTGRKALFKDFQEDLTKFETKNSHFGSDILSIWIESNIRNRSFIEVHAERNRKKREGK